MPSKKQGKSSKKQGKQKGGVAGAAVSVIEDPQSAGGEGQEVPAEEEPTDDPVSAGSADGVDEPGEEKADSAAGEDAGKSKRKLFPGGRVRAAVRDEETGEVYPSKSAVGKHFAQLVDSSPLDRFAWYKLVRKFPGRFVEV